MANKVSYVSRKRFEFLKTITKIRLPSELLIGDKDDHLILIDYRHIKEDDPNKHPLDLRDERPLPYGIRDSVGSIVRIHDQKTICRGTYFEDFSEAKPKDLEKVLLPNPRWYEYYEGTMVRVFKTNGKIYFCTKNKLDGRGHKFSGTTETLYEAWKRLDGPELETFFPEAEDHDLIYEFSVVTKHRIIASVIGHEKILLTHVYSIKDGTIYEPDEEIDGKLDVKFATTPHLLPGDRPTWKHDDKLRIYTFGAVFTEDTTNRYPILLKSADFRYRELIRGPNPYPLALRYYTLRLEHPNLVEDDKLSSCMWEGLTDLEKFDSAILTCTPPCQTDELQRIIRDFDDTVESVEEFIDKTMNDLDSGNIHETDLDKIVFAEIQARRNNKPVKRTGQSFFRLASHAQKAKKFEAAHPGIIYKSGYTVPAKNRVGYILSK